MTAASVFTSIALDWMEEKSRRKAMTECQKGIAPVVNVAGLIRFDRPQLDLLCKLATIADDNKVRPVLVGVSKAAEVALSVTGLEKYFIIDGDAVAPESIIVPNERKVSFVDQHIVLIRCTALVSILAVTVLLTGCRDQPTLLPIADQVSSPYVPTIPVPSRFSMRCQKPLPLPRMEIENASFTSNVLENASPIHGSGDVVRIDIAEGAEFSGTYAIDLDGTLTLPYAGSIRAKGLTSAELSKSVAKQLVNGGYFRSEHARVSVLPLRWAPAQINIFGAVFNPGRAVINDLPKEKQDASALDSVGDAPITRYLDAGLRGGAGVRPDADLTKIEVIRYGRRFVVDMSGIVTGDPVPDVAMMTGDQIRVASSGCYHPELMRPSQITPAGIRIFMSNLTQPATGNAASFIEHYASNLPYGTKLLQAAVSSNCVGGSAASNAHRSIILISANPITGQTEIIERSIENLLKNANRDDQNPYLLPNDAVACYDSGITNLREAAKTFTEVLSPLRIVLGGI
jgi:polysaccharide biosynthesis/export protein